MLSRVRSGLTYANIVSSLALFLVLTGGTAVALTGSNTVFSDDITNDQVRSADVRNDSLTGGGLVGGDIRPNSLTGSDINERSLSTSPLWAHVSMYASSVVVTRSSPGVSAERLSTGYHRVVFPRDVSNCGYVATLGGARASVTSGDDIQTYLDGFNDKAVQVQTKGSGSLRNADFYLAVVC